MGVIGYYVDFFFFDVLNYFFVDYIKFFKKDIIIMWFNWEVVLNELKLYYDCLGLFVSLLGMFFILEDNFGLFYWNFLGLDYFLVKV